MKTIEETLECLTQEFIATFNVSREYINFGHCFVWAWLAHRLYPESDLGWDSGHCWIRMKGKYYDSDDPFGVSRPSLLEVNRIYKASDPTPRYRGDAACISYWTRKGNEIGVSNLQNHYKIDKILKQVKKEMAL